VKWRWTQKTHDAVTNRFKTSRLSLIFLILVGAVAGCATLPPDPSLLDNARTAIELAERAGAREYAPIELRLARERLSSAEFELDRNQADAARRLSDEAEIEARLALARTQAALARAELAQKQRDLEQLRSDLVEAFGDEVLER
jgi:hypothetical protein